MEKNDSTVFTIRVNGDLFVCQIYVDDIIFGSTNTHFSEKFGRLMSEKFEMYMMCEPKFFLSLQIKQTKEGTFVSQTQYTKDLFKKFNMQEILGMKTPMPTSGHLDLTKDGEPVDQKVYCSMIGSLLYLCASRPDIMLSVCICARYQASPKECHLKDVKRIVRYVIHTPNFGIWYPKRPSFDLVGDSDSDYAGDKVDRKSTSGT